MLTDMCHDQLSCMICKDMQAYFAPPCWKGKLAEYRSDHLIRFPLA